MYSGQRGLAKSSDGWQFNEPAPKTKRFSCSVGRTVLSAAIFPPKKSAKPGPSAIFSNRVRPLDRRSPSTSRMRKLLSFAHDTARFSEVEVLDRKSTRLNS